MKYINRPITLLALTACMTMARSTKADTTISTFDTPGFSPPNALYASWSSATVTPTPTNYIIGSSGGYGSLWKQVGPINAAGNSNIVFDVTLSSTDTNASGKIGPIITLTDGDGTVVSYRWYGRTLGNHILTGSLSNVAQSSDNGATNNTGYLIVGNPANLDLSSIWHLNVELDPSTYGGAYTVALNDVKFTSGSSGVSTGVCAVVSSFDNLSLSGTYGNWTTQTPTANSLQITASGFGGGFRGVTPAINTTSDKTLQLNVTLTAPSGANGTLGPIVVLEDGDGTQLRYTWYGQNPGTNLVLTSALNAGVVAQAGSVPGFDFSTISFFHIQLDPSTYSGSYTVAWNDLSIIGCDGGGDGGGGTNTGVCATISTFDNFFMGGDYVGWQSANEVSTATSWQMTATGFGGGFAAITPNITTTPDRTLQFNVTLTAPAEANGKLGPLVILEDGDGTQLRYAWYGQSPGTNLVLTSALSAGVNAQAGSTPGFDFNSIAFFHLQLDPSSYSGSYTIAANDLSIIGCPAETIQITSFSYNSSSGQFTLMWTSDNGATYAIQAGSDLSSLTDLVTGIPSSGSTTTATVTPGNATKSFLRVRKQ
ncbi:hypothetical protein [Pedosphaera parvula]|uniref:Uncharacterized protein n=1 Tax=Pedosphaera parvula (strain Ellin514) TaxID=320771 RepID=B9XHM5_PEDPL|nr:hypothetical protein [Pedosphaera parvula]EEF60603.1 hypothetical protein Cflav_PD6193 [Pedosphaera parvula Ellin514]